MNTTTQHTPTSIRITQPQQKTLTKHNTFGIAVALADGKLTGTAEQFVALAAKVLTWYDSSEMRYATSPLSRSMTTLGKNLLAQAGTVSQ